MRTFLHSILIALYFLVATGFSYSVHYCGESIESVSIVGKKAISCCGEMEEEPNDCCKDEVKVVQLKEKYVGEDHIDVKLQPVFEECTTDNTETLIIQKFTEKKAIQEHYRPPPLFVSFPSLFIKNRVLIL